VLVLIIVLSEHVIMPRMPLRRKLLEELDDVDHAFKCACLSKYLEDISIASFLSLSASDSDSTDASLTSSISSISSVSSVSVSSVSSVSSLNSDDQPTLLLLSDINKMYASQIQACIDQLCHHIITKRVLRKNPAIEKASQFHLLKLWHNGNLDQYRKRVCVDPNIFDGIINTIHDHNIFHNNSNVPQAPIKIQLAIFLFRAGHYGNAASPEAIGHWAGVSLGTVVNCTNCVMLALISIHDKCVYLPTAEEKESAKAWVAEQVCPKWSDGYIMVDGTKFLLFQRPGLHGDTWFDKN